MGGLHGSCVCEELGMSINICNGRFPVEGLEGRIGKGLGKLRDGAGEVEDVRSASTKAAACNFKEIFYGLATRSRVASSEKSWESPPKLIEFYQPYDVLTNP